MAYDGIKFQFDEEKALEALTYIGSKWPGISAYYVAKVMYFAEKYHLNRYSRPIVADTFIAMENGPVPSVIYDIIRGKLSQLQYPRKFSEALDCCKADKFDELTALREPEMDVFSRSDIACIDEAIAYCREDRDLSAISHEDRAWQEAAPNSPMDYAKIIDEENEDNVLETAREFAAYGVL